MSKFKKIMLSVTVLLILFINPSCSSKEAKIKEAQKWHQKGWDFVEEKKYNEAVACFDKALQLDEKNSKILFNKGNALMCQGRYKECLECFDKALEIDPKNDYVKYNRDTVIMLIKKEEEKNKQGK